MSSTVVISHSEVDSFLLCEQRHFYAFAGEGLEPKQFGDSLYRGIVGHEGMAAYYTALQEGSSKADAAEVGLAACRKFGLDPEAKFGILADLSTRILPMYFETVSPLWDKGWKVLAVEKTFRLEVPTADRRLVYPFKPDLIIADSAGNIQVVDHKFIYNFYQMDEINLLPQIPKYIGALRALGKPVSGGIYNMIRWRAVKDAGVDANYRREPFKPSNARIRQAFTQQVKIMRKIAELKERSVVDWQSEITRTQNSMICKSCSFRALCINDINGEDSTLMRKVEFRPNSYGYSEEE